MSTAHHLLGPGRQPRRDRPPRLPQRARRWGCAAWPSTSTPTPTRRSCADADEAVRLTAGYLDGAGDHRRRARDRRRGDPPRLRLPVRERRLRPGGHRRRAGVGRAPARGRSPPWATSWRPSARRSRPACRPCRPPTIRTTPTEVGLPAARQGRGRRRRQGHARSSTRPAELDEAVAAARREAPGGFGDDRVFLERYVARSRHVEIQILGDAARQPRAPRRARVLASSAATRRSSRSRRRPWSTTAMRAAMGDAALTPRRAIGYQSAGTVEFLVDDATREFFFLEVNTRLQVEHPVTEAVTGIDLVREQLRVAVGEPLGLRPGRRRVARPRHRGAALRRGPGRRLPARHGHARRVRARAEPDRAVGLRRRGRLGGRRRLRPDARQGDRPRAHPRRGGGAPGARARAPAPRRRHDQPRLPRGHAARIPASCAGDTTTDFIERRGAARPRSSSTTPSSQRVATLAALWIQGQNRADATVLAGRAERVAQRPPARRSGSPSPSATVTVEVRLPVAARRLASRSAPTPRRACIAWSPDAIDVEVDGRRIHVARHPRRRRAASSRACGRHGRPPPGRRASRCPAHGWRARRPRRPDARRRARRARGRRATPSPPVRRSSSSRR